MMKCSGLIQKLQERIDCCGDDDVWVVDGPSDIGKMDEGCPVASVRSADDGAYICLSDWR